MDRFFTVDIHSLLLSSFTPVNPKPSPERTKDPNDERNLSQKNDQNQALKGRHTQTMDKVHCQNYKPNLKALKGRNTKTRTYQKA